jgi:hypothetical protein
MNSLQDSAWLAGLLEGEGYFAVQKPAPSSTKGTRVKLRVALSMTDEDVVIRAMQIMPGAAFDIHNSENCPSSANNKAPRKDQFRARWSGMAAQNLMRRILPYMGERRKAKIEECLRTPDLSHQGGKE